MPYSSSLSDTQWIVIHELLRSAGLTTRKRKHPLRGIVDACLYVVNNGTKWRELPNDFPPWQTVYYHFSHWSRTQIWEALSFALSELAREACSRQPSPSLISIDSQSLTGEPGIDERGLDGNKKVNGRKRHIVVDVCGFLFGCIVTPANQADLHGGNKLLELVNDGTLFPRLEKVLGDSTYRNAGKGEKVSVTVEAQERKPGQRGFVPEAYRWVVERTFSWLNRSRRICRNYEKKPSNQEAMNFIANIRLCLRRVERALI